MWGKKSKSKSKTKPIQVKGDSVLISKKDYDKLVAEARGGSSRFSAFGQPTRQRASTVSTSTKGRTKNGKKDKRCSRKAKRKAKKKAKGQTRDKKGRFKKSKK